MAKLKAAEPVDASFTVPPHEVEDYAFPLGAELEEAIEEPRTDPEYAENDCVCMAKRVESVPSLDAALTWKGPTLTVIKTRLIFVTDVNDFCLVYTASNDDNDPAPSWVFTVDDVAFNKGPSMMFDELGKLRKLRTDGTRAPADLRFAEVDNREAKDRFRNYFLRDVKRKMGVPELEEIKISGVTL